MDSGYVDYIATGRNFSFSKVGWGRHDSKSRELKMKRTDEESCSFPRPGQAASNKQGFFFGGGKRKEEEKRGGTNEVPLCVFLKERRGGGGIDCRDSQPFFQHAALNR